MTQSTTPDQSAAIAGSNPNLNDHYVVIFDGVCIFCHAAVNFIIKRDSQARFLFCPLQTELAAQLLQPYPVNSAGCDTLYLLKQGNCYTFSSAALEICKDLNSFWYLLTVLRIVPKACRDYLYQAFASRRYAWFGKANHCILPRAEYKSRFIGL